MSDPERRVGEVFVFEDQEAFDYPVKMKAVIDYGSGCRRCFFDDNETGCFPYLDIIGECLSGERSDGLKVIFIEVEG